MDPTYSERDYWEARYRAGLDSGPGSGGSEAQWKVEQILQACKGRKIRTILDLGCGDGRLGRAVLAGLPGATYLGLDQAPAAVELCRAHAPEGAEYAEGDLTAAELPQADLVLCLDVLFHLSSEDRHYAAIAKVTAAAKKVAVVAAWNPKIVDLYKGEFAPHTVFRPFGVSDPAVKVDEVELPQVPQKSLFLLTRPRRR